MILRSPFHERTSAQNETGLWSHWSGYLAATKYQLSDKFEYYAVRARAAVLDTSPLYKYRITGPDAERFLAGVLARDVTSCAPGSAQYTLWCDSDGFVLEDGVIFRQAPDEFMLTAAEPNLGYFGDLIGHQDVQITEVTSDIGALALQGPRSRDILAVVAPDVADLGYFKLAESNIAGCPVTVSRTGYTGDLGYEVWVETADALAVWDAIFEAGAPRGLIPFGLTALKMARIEAGLLLLDTDFSSSRFAFTDAQRFTPAELGLGWMVRSLDRAFIGRNAIAASGEQRWSTVGIEVDWRAYDELYESNGLIPPKDHVPLAYETLVYDDERRQLGYATSFMYSPILQRHIGIARVRPESAAPGTSVHIEVTVDHRYELVPAITTRLPHYDPPQRRT